MQAASYLAFACEHLNKPQELIAKAFGDSHAALAMETMRLMQLQKQARTRLVRDAHNQVQIEFVRRMLLAFSRDLRVVVLRLASRLQTCVICMLTKKPALMMWPESLCRCLHPWPTAWVFGKLNGRWRTWLFV